MVLAAASTTAVAVWRGTVDQALLATLNVKHHFVRLWGLANRVVVLDEVHAYDTYTGTLIVALVRWLKAMGSSVVLMSATLPRKTRNELISAWGASTGEVPDQAYPRVTLVDDGVPRSQHVPARSLKPIECHGLDESLEAIAEQAAALIQEGGCGAVIVNTVDRAQTLYSMLVAARDDPNRTDVGDDIQLVLFHARFPADDRAERETTVLELFGGGEETRPRAALLIATQVAEQSLDLDFDFMLSDLAPVDLVLQRAGRMHRHERHRPGQHDSRGSGLLGWYANDCRHWRKQPGGLFMTHTYWGAPGRFYATNPCSTCPRISTAWCRQSTAMRNCRITSAKRKGHSSRKRLGVSTLVRNKPCISRQ